ncbi:MAG TPA: rod shape-determining protein MreC [Tepidisphaeraceae bacterium]|nr:rod shape-determining protein MreC [Tepidisphaeraceae bacterium]
MGQIRGQHVFTVLMGAAALTAFVIPPRFTAFAKPHMESLFAPVARPAAAVAARVRQRIDPVREVDDRPAEDVKAENGKLRNTVVYLSQQLAQLKQINADRESIGEARRLCTPVAVVGSDASTVRETLLLSAGTNDNIAKDMAALYAGGMVAGRVSSAGVGGAQLRLLTDPGFAVTGSFRRWEPQPDGGLRLIRIALPATPVVGAGRNAMVAPYLSVDATKAAGVQPGDWVVLDDATWPEALQGYRLGKVMSVEPSPKAPLQAEIRVEPQGELVQLREVMVMNKTKLEAEERPVARSE